MRTLMILALAGVALGACSNTWEGLQRDMDNVNKGQVPNTSAAEPNSETDNY